MTNQAKVNPTLQEILDKDTAVHDYLIQVVNQMSPEGPATAVGQAQLGLILAVGLSAIHDRLGEMWRWDKAVDPS